MRTPTVRQRSQERSVLYPLLADSVIVVAIGTAALLTGSLTLLGEGTRIFLILLAGYWSLWCLVGVHRGSLGRYEFGTSKLECLATALCGCCLLIGGLFLCEAVVSMIFSDHRAASPAGLAIAALVNAINVLINALGLIAMLRAREAIVSEAFRAQLKVRWILLTASLGVQFTLTVSVLAKDAAIAKAFDALGASFVATLMIARGIGMVAHAMPTLLDARAPERIREAIGQAIGTIMPEARVLALRTRIVGDRYVAEVDFDGNRRLSTEVLRRKSAAVVDELASRNCPVELKLVPAARSRGTAKNLPVLEGTT